MKKKKSRWETATHCITREKTLPENLTLALLTKLRSVQRPFSAVRSWTYALSDIIAHLHYCQFHDGSSGAVDRVISKRHQQKSDRGEHDPSRFMFFHRVFPIKSFAFGTRRGTLRSVHLANRTRPPVTPANAENKNIVRWTNILYIIYSRARVFGVNRSTDVLLLRRYNVFDGRARAKRWTFSDGRERRTFFTRAQPLAHEQDTTTLYSYHYILRRTRRVYNVILPIFRLADPNDLNYGNCRFHSMRLITFDHFSINNM